MNLYLIRHAHAGPRTVGHRDKYRQLTDEGRRQADTLADHLAPLGVTTIVSSPATRCVQTVEPTARAAAVDLVEHDHLWEDTYLDDVLLLIESLRRDTGPDGAVVVCSHGNVIPAVVEHLARVGVPIHGRGCERASIWRVHGDVDRWDDATYLTPRSSYQVL